VAARLLTLAIVGVMASTYLAAQTASLDQRRPTSVRSAADDPATPLFNRLCTECHDAARITEPRRTPADWKRLMTQMIGEGVSGTDEELQTVYDYLLRHYDKVLINRATTDEMIKVIGLSAAYAAAIVAYRTANGDFADFDALKKVPNIDAQNLEEHKATVAFESAPKGSTSRQ
jgi:competence ComEA-like helix-hairpin-helix protein